MSPKAQLIYNFLLVLWHNNVRAVTSTARELFTGLIWGIVALYGIAFFSLLTFTISEHRVALIVGLLISIVIAFVLLLRSAVITEVIQLVGTYGPYDTAERLQALVFSLVTYLLTFYWLAIFLPFHGQTWGYFAVGFGIYIMLSHIKGWKLVIFDYLLWGLFLINLILIFAVPLWFKLDKHSPWNLMAKIESYRMMSVANRRVDSQRELGHQMDIARCGVIRQFGKDPGAVDLKLWKSAAKWKAHAQNNAASWKALSDEDLRIAKLRCSVISSARRYDDIQASRVYDSIHLKTGIGSARRLNPLNRTNFSCKCDSSRLACPTSAVLAYGTNRALMQARQSQACRRQMRYVKTCLSPQKNLVIRARCGNGAWSRRRERRCIRSQNRWCSRYSGRSQRRDAQGCQQVFSNTAGNSTTIDDLKSADLSDKVVMLMATPDARGIVPTQIILRCHYDLWPVKKREIQRWKERLYTAGK